MAFDALLIHTIEIYRRREVDGKRVRDRFSQEQSVNPRQHTVGGETLIHTYSCRANRGRGGMLQEERMVDVFQQMWTVYTMPDVDILTDDAARVLDENGNELVPMSKIKVKSAAAGMLGTHHLEFELWAQSGPS